MHTVITVNTSALLYNNTTVVQQLTVICSVAWFQLCSVQQYADCPFR